MKQELIFNLVLFLSLFVGLFLIAIILKKARKMKDDNLMAYKKSEPVIEYEFDEDQLLFLQ